jgi:NAD(P)-dependent dehydrogenase (short-subunit alcohol dehydrogenase family)
MPNIKLARKDIAALAQGQPLVVVLIGATTGIGSYVARALANTFTEEGAKLRVYIIGRNASRAETLLTYGRQRSPGSDWRFIPVPDLTLISDVDRFSQEIIKQEEASPFAGGPPRIDLLYMSQALSPLQASPSTSPS